MEECKALPHARLQRSEARGHQRILVAELVRHAVVVQAGEAAAAARRGDRAAVL